MCRGAALARYVRDAGDGACGDAEGCAARLEMSGDDGTLVLTFAATDDEGLAGTGVFTPTGGAPCKVTLTGHYSQWQRGE